MSIEKHTHINACSGILKPPRQSPWGQGREWKYWSTEIYSIYRQLARKLLLTVAVDLFPFSTYILHLTSNKVKFGPYMCKCLLQWQRCLRRKPMTALLLRLWVRIPRRDGMFDLSVVCFQVEVHATSWSLVQRSTTDCGGSLCVIWNPQTREAMVRIRPRLHKKKSLLVYIYIYICTKTSGRGSTRKKVCLYVYIYMY